MPSGVPGDFPYAWCESWGEDRYGLWCAFSYAGVRQVMRWMEPGEFVMGSPEGEPERHSDEVQRHVILTQGFWLAETTCTQALWQEVMNQNPSQFKGDDLPVERVSWHDVQGFLAKLNREIQDLHLSLPSEAQWEYACRAGSTTPFHFGPMLPTEKANYNGNYTYAWGPMGEFSRRTLAAKSFEANAWGLYQMHGNLWEWCLDQYAEYTQGDLDRLDPQRELATVINPVQVKGNSTDVDLVLRGGSWFSDPRRLRSAYRGGIGPAVVHHLVGFRFARVAEP